jgi:hypothetical protein
MAPPKKRKRQADMAKAASKEPQDHSELVPKQQHLQSKAPKAPTTAPPTGSQDSLLRLRQDFHSESESEESEASIEEAEGSNTDESESEKKLDIAPLNKYLDQDIKLERELEEETDQSDIEEDCNRAFRFIDAYRKELSVKQAAWYVKKQNSYRVISEALIREFDIQPEGVLKKGN